MQTKKSPVKVIGGGLAGCAAALELAKAGIEVELYEMRPHQKTGAHKTGQLAELVCSNSLGSQGLQKGSGLLLAELQKLGCQLIQIAEKAKVPAGSALALDRQVFSDLVESEITNSPLIQLIRQEYPQIPNSPAIIASGPLTSPQLSQSLNDLTGEDHLFFYDALSPIVVAESIDLAKTYRASRYDTENPGDYINCPLTKEQYLDFVKELTTAKTIELKEFETDIQSGVKTNLSHFFESCLPIEIMAKRGEQTLAYGPLRPTGFGPKKDRPFAVVQLRQDNLAASLYNLVGFQTNLKFGEQERIFRKIPGLENAEFVRFGQMHRNTFLCSPQILDPFLECKKKAGLYFAGQITGVEGYLGNIATGFMAAKNLSAKFLDLKNEPLPQKTMLGALLHYISHSPAKDFQPMKANFGLLPPLDIQKRVNKATKREMLSQRALKEVDQWLEAV